MVVATVKEDNMRFETGIKDIAERITD